MRDKFSLYIVSIIAAIALLAIFINDPAVHSDISARSDNTVGRAMAIYNDTLDPGTSVWSCRIVGNHLEMSSLSSQYPLDKLVIDKGQRVGYNNNIVSGKWIISLIDGNASSGTAVVSVLNSMTGSSSRVTMKRGQSYTVADLTILLDSIVFSTSSLRITLYLMPSNIASTGDLITKERFFCTGNNLYQTSCPSNVNVNHDFVVSLKQTCAYGCSNGACLPVPGCSPSLEKCNNIDDDCDGYIDEDLNLNKSCSISGGTGFVSSNCSSGVSSTGSCIVYSCYSGYFKSGNSCIPFNCSGPATQNCTVANGFGSQSRTCSAGVWSSWGVCTVTSCNANYVKGVSNTSCVLSSCSGSATQNCTVGVGACRRFGVQSRTCSNNVWSAWSSCSVVAGTPISEVCDNVDNDCDGSVDEALTATQSCNVTNGFGSQSRTCNSGVWSSWGVCIVTSCNANYVISGNNTCIASGTTDTIPPAIAFSIPPTPINGATVTTLTQQISAYISDASNSIYSFMDFDNSLILWLRMDGSAVDSSPKKWSTTDTGVTYTQGKFGRAATGFTEINKIMVDSALDYASTDMTISFWVNVYDYTIPERQNPFGKAFGGDGTLTLEPSGTMNFYFGSTGVDDWPYTSPSSETIVIPNVWEHWVMVRDVDSHTAQWFKNGVVASSVFDYSVGTDIPYNDASIDAVIHSSNPLTIGDNYVNPLNGAIDEFMIFNRVLTLSEIKALYDSKNNRFDATLTNIGVGQHTYTLYATDGAGNTANSGKLNFYISGGVACIDLVMSQNCSIEYGFGIQTSTCNAGIWSNWSTCTPIGCYKEYHILGNACVSDSKGSENITSCGAGYSFCGDYCYLTNQSCVDSIIGATSAIRSGYCSGSTWSVGTCCANSCNSNYGLINCSCTPIVIPPPVNDTNTSLPQLPPAIPLPPMPSLPPVIPPIPGINGTLAYCGNGRIDPGEMCDNGTLNSNTICDAFTDTCNYCDTSCISHTIECKNGTVRTEFYTIANGLVTRHADCIGDFWVWGNYFYNCSLGYVNSGNACIVNTTTQPIVWTNELMINGGFETGDSTGWTLVNGTSYGFAVGNYVGGVVYATPQSGNYLIYSNGDSDASGVDFYIYQDVNLGNYVNYIDTGNAVINASAWTVSSEYGGYGIDYTRIQIHFLDSTRQVIETALDTGYASNMNDIWQKNEITTAIPRNTRYVRMLGTTYENCTHLGTFCNAGSLDTFSVRVGYKTNTTGPICIPNCANRQCGSDGCQGECGYCIATETCSAQGQCIPNTQYSRTFYVSATGNDYNSGTSESAPWQTLTKVNSMTFQPGDGILFKRGDTWRGQLVPDSGSSSGYVTYGAYGSGVKPKILGSVDCTSGWTNVGTNIWQNSNSAFNVDVGNMIFNNEQSCGIKQLSASPTLDTQGDFWYDSSNYRVRMYSVGSPSTVYSHIECALKRNIIGANVPSYVIFENLDIRYGAGHGFGFYSGTNNITIRNCDISYIGGGAFTDSTGNVRYGNGIEFWESASNIRVEGCKIDNIYDAAITTQGTSDGRTLSNVYFVNNNISNSEYSFEYWFRESASTANNIHFENNICTYAGGGFGHNQRPDMKNGRHLMIFSNPASTSNVYIRYNTFYEATESLESLTDLSETSGITIDYNTLYQSSGHIGTIGWTTNYDTLSAWQSASGKDIHSTFGGNICTPTTCTAQGYNCGNWPNGCNTGTISCGTCTGGYTCSSFGQCVSGASGWQSGVVSWWKFNGDANDFMGVRNGVVSGATSVSSGCISGQCYSFDGINDYVGVSYASQYNIREAITLSIWIKRLTGYNQTRDVMLLGRDPSWYFYDAYDSGLIRGDVFIDGVRSAGLYSNIIPFDNKWYNVVYTYDSSTGYSGMYQNGVLVSSTRLTGLSNYLIDSSTTNFRDIGYQTLGRRMMLDEAMIWNRALSSTEVQQLYNSFQANYTCAPSCVGKTCGDDGCGGSCGTCISTQTCVGNTCIPLTCSGPTTQSCNITNGIGSQSRTCNSGTWSSWSTCTVTSCNTGYTQNGNTCIPITGTPKGNGTTYYISTTGNDYNSGTSESAPWQTLTKVNSMTFNPGDTILFKRGETWYGSLTIKTSGTSGNPITYGAYGGVGDKPIITGLTTITGWSSYGSGTYYKALTVQSSPLIVLVNGVNTPKGRWPDASWLLYDSLSGNTQITDGDLNGRNFIGGEFVTRINSWITYTVPISSHSGSTINFPWIYSTQGVDYTMKGGQGYFIQNDIDTFNILGDWAYVNGNLYMYFGSNSPSSYQVRVSTVNESVYMNNKEYITFDNIIFEGANTNGIQIRNSRHITVTNCVFRYMGGNGIYGPWDGDSSYMRVENCEFTENNNCGIRVQGDHEYATIRYNTFRNIGMIDGLANSLDGSAIGIMATGRDTLIEYNNIDYTGYNGISFGMYNGENSIVRNNFVNHHCQKKDDGAGIYTYSDSSLGKQIINNVVLNGMAHAEGVKGYIPDGQHEGVYHEYDNAHGVYIDGSDNVLISGNTIASNEGSGIFLNTQSLNINVQNNIIYNNIEAIQIISNRGGGGEITGATILNNTFFARNTSQYTLYYATGSGDSGVRQLGTPSTINNNYYVRPIDDTNTFRTQINIWNDPQIPRTLAGWQSYSGFDANSKKSPKAITTSSDIRFEYNPTGSSKSVSLGSNYIDVTGKSYPGSVTLGPYSSVVLIKN
ncbi:MAG: LamG-like jellyroll fold domain-containing protein [Candidatus Woesearchaeota archaeon]